VRERERSFHFVQTRAWRISSNGFEAEDPPNFPFFIPEFYRRRNYFEAERRKLPGKAVGFGLKLQ